MADALDSKSGVPWTCGFDPHLRYHVKDQTCIAIQVFFCICLYVFEKF